MSQPTLLSADKAQALKLADATQTCASGIVSRTLLQTPEARVVLFTFAADQVGAWLLAAGIGLFLTDMIGVYYIVSSARRET